MVGYTHLFACAFVEIGPASRAWKAALAGLLGVFLLIGCGRPTPQKKLLLYCGAGIRPPVAEAAEVFGKENDVTIECDYAGSNVLLSRIKLARRGDLYMPGDVHYVNQAEAEGFILSKRTVCYFIPVILVPKGNPKGIQGLRDLTKPGVRLGLGDAQACAIGRKSVKIFQKNNIPVAEVEKNVVFSSLTVNELGVHIKAGKTDAVMVWAPIAAYYADVGDVVHIPVEQNLISTVAIGVLSFSRNRETAEEFARFLTSDRGREIFRKHHYTTEMPGQ